MSMLDRARDVLTIEMQAIANVRDLLGDGFTNTVNLILKSLASGHKIAVSGIGKNHHIAQKISATLASTGSTSVVLNPTQALHGDLGILSAGDVLLALSYSGETAELLDLVPVARRLGVSVIAVTGVPDSPLARCSDVTLPVTVPKEACPFNMAPTASTTATLAVGDALAMVLLEARGFRIEDYAKLHPGGTIGRTLLLRVSDIMRAGDRLATVPDTATVQDAIVAMTRARSGSACVLGPKKELLGIFTDGDLRRHLPEQPDILRRPVQSIMTAKPVSVRGDQLAVDALRIFETHNIDDLPVTNALGHLIGSVDIQDLPKFKIM